MKFDRYLPARSLQEAYEANQARRAIVLGGTGWCKMSRRSYATAIDLSGLGLGGIEETDEEFVLGAMATLREVETHPGLNAYTGNAARDSVKHIVGTQFRRSATVGGTVWSRFGFSDPLTLLLVLDAQVELYRGGRIPVAEFAAMPKDRDLLLRVHIAKTPMAVAYTSFRVSSTDFPVLTAAVSAGPFGLRGAVGARPGRAVLITAPEEAGLLKQAEQLVYGDNLRGSGEYRRALAQVLLRRALARCKEERPWK